MMVSIDWATETQPRPRRWKIQPTTVRDPEWRKEMSEAFESIWQRETDAAQKWAEWKLTMKKKSTRFENIQEARMM